MTSTPLRRVLTGVLGLVAAYGTVVLLAWTSWTTAETAAAWLRGSTVLLLAAALCGVTAAWLLVGAALGKRPWALVIALGLAPAVVAVLVGSSRY